MAFKIKKEKGFEQEVKVPFWKHPKFYGYTGVGVATTGFASVVVGSFVLPNSMLLPIGLGEVFAGQFAVMGAYPKILKGIGKPKIEYAYRFYPNKYDKKGAIVLASDKEEAQRRYATHLLLQKGYNPRQIKKMSKEDVKFALEKRKAR